MKKKKKSGTQISSVVKQMVSGEVPIITMDDAAELLKNNPELLGMFEKSYSDKIKEIETEKAPVTDSKQMTNIVNKQNKGQTTDVNEELLSKVIDTIVKDLVAVTRTFRFNGDLNSSNCTETTDIALSDGELISKVSEDDLKQLPLEHRPIITAAHAVKDIPGKSSMLLLKYYKDAVEKIGTEEGMQAYHRFRQGLDILDIDDVSYFIISQNRNSMGYWLPKLIEAASDQTFFNIPRTTVVKLPITILQLTKLEYAAINKTTRKILDTWAKQVFDLKSNGDYFLKTGTYSFKFDFRNVRVKDPAEIEEIGEYLLYIHGYANQCAGPLFNPCIYGMSTTDEWVIRDFIESKEKVPTIYNGLPLHVEYRVFIDCDTHEILSIHPYWDPDGMKKHFSKYAKGGNINHIHDYVVFKSYEDKMMQKYNENKDSVVANLQQIVDRLNLTGQWSLDIMDDGEKLWLIDMAVAEQSTFYESVPEEKRRPVLEEWIPGAKPVMPPWYNQKAIELATNKKELKEHTQE